MPFPALFRQAIKRQGTPGDANKTMLQKIWSTVQVVVSWLKNLPANKNGKLSIIALYAAIYTYLYRVYITLLNSCIRAVVAGVAGVVYVTFWRRSNENSAVFCYLEHMALQKQTQKSGLHNSERGAIN